MNDIDVIATLLEQIEKARQHGDVNLEAFSYTTLGNQYCERQQWADAREAFTQAVALFQDLGNPTQVAVARIGIADTFIAEKEWQRAIDECDIARQVLEAAGDLAGLERVYTNLGVLYWQIGEWRKTLDWYHKRLELVQKLGDPHLIAHVSANLGVLYHFFGHRDNAAHYLSRAYLLAHEHQDMEMIDRAGTQLANVFGDYDIANFYLRDVAGPNAPFLQRKGTPEQRQAMEQIVEMVEQALRGDAELKRELLDYTQQLANDEAQSDEMREIGCIFHEILQGTRSPDLSALDGFLATPILELLARLPRQGGPQT